MLLLNVRKVRLTAAGGSLCANALKVDASAKIDMAPIITRMPMIRDLSKLSVSRGEPSKPWRGYRRASVSCRRNSWPRSFTVMRSKFGPAFAAARHSQATALSPENWIVFGLIPALRQISATGMPWEACFRMNAFWASENLDAFIALRSSQPGNHCGKL